MRGERASCGGEKVVGVGLAPARCALQCACVRLGKRRPLDTTLRCPNPNRGSAIHACQPGSRRSFLPRLSDQQDPLPAGGAGLKAAAKPTAVTVSRPRCTFRRLSGSGTVALSSLSPALASGRLEWKATVHGLTRSRRSASRNASVLGLRFAVGQALHAADRLEESLAELPAAVGIGE